MRWRRDRGISRELFAQVANFSVRKLATYEQASVLPAKVARPVTETMRLIAALEQLAGDEKAFKAWLRAPNDGFGGETPLELIRRGESDLLWEIVHQLRQGQFA